MAIDPYGPEKDSVFHVKFGEHRVLPVRVIISNDTDQPLSLADAHIQFTTSRKAKGEPLTKDDVERAVANSVEPQDRSTTGVPLPMPIPRRKPKRLPKDTDEEIDYLLFKAEAVEPHNTQSGFLFFDVSGVSAGVGRIAHLFTRAFATELDRSCSTSTSRCRSSSNIGPRVGEARPSKLAMISNGSTTVPVQTSNSEWSDQSCSVIRLRFLNRSNRLIRSWGQFGYKCPLFQSIYYCF
jgi:hypothetical protein